LGQAGTEFFLQTGLDWWNRIDPTGEFFLSRRSAEPVIAAAPSAGRFILIASDGSRLALRAKLVERYALSREEC
jgi:hypothetical protein